MWELNHNEGWAPKNWCFQTVVLEKTLESPLDCKEIKPVSPKGNQSWIFSGRTDAEIETPILWPPDVKNWFIGKDPDAGKDGRQEEKVAIKDEMVRWHHCLNGHERESVEVKVAQSCLTLCHPMDCSLPGSSVHDILQTRKLDWVAVPFSRGSSWPGDQTQVSALQAESLLSEPPEKSVDRNLSKFCES